jgi:hypothetical protein
MGDAWAYHRLCEGGQGVQWTVGGFKDGGVLGWLASKRWRLCISARTHQWRASLMGTSTMRLLKMSMFLVHRCTSLCDACGAAHHQRRKGRVGHIKHNTPQGPHAGT